MITIKKTISMIFLAILTGSCSGKASLESQVEANFEAIYGSPVKGIALFPGGQFHHPDLFQGSG